MSLRNLPVPEALVGAGPGHTFLVTCLRSHSEPAARDAARALARATTLDWPALDGLARAEWLAPLVYRAVQGHDLVPPELEEAWRNLYFASLKRNLLLLHELDILVHGLQGAGVAPILLKGAALIKTVYDDPGTRPMDDVDLLLREDDVRTALRVLQALGYATDEPFAYFGEAPAHKKAGLGAAVDLHWSLVGLPHYQRLIPAGWLWARARAVALDSGAALVLSPEAQILHLCAHLALQHQGQALRLVWLCDIARVLSVYGAEIDWDELLAYAQAYDLVLPLQSILAPVAARWPGAAPAPFLDRLAGLQPSASEARLARTWQVHRRSPFGVVWSGLVSQPTWAGRLRYVGAHLFPSPAYMRHRYHIRHGLLLPLYYPGHWLAAAAGGLAHAATALPRAAHRPAAR